MLREASVWKVGMFIGLREEGAFGVAQHSVLKFGTIIRAVHASAPSCFVMNGVWLLKFSSVINLEGIGIYLPLCSGNVLNVRQYGWHLPLHS